MLPLRKNSLGYIAIPSPDPLSTAVNIGAAALTFLPKAANIFGRGRREADQLVPHQKDLYARIRASQVALARTDLPVEAFQKIEAALVKNWKWMQDLLFDPRWTDGRASQQGYDDMRMYVEGLTAAGKRVTRHENPDRGGQLGPRIHPGGALGALNKRINDMLGAFDWGRLQDLGFDIAERFMPGGKRIEPYVIQTPQGPVLYDPNIGGDIEVFGRDPGPPLDVPGWVYPALVGAGVLVGGALLMNMGKRR